MLQLLHLRVRLQHRGLLLSVLLLVWLLMLLQLLKLLLMLPFFARVPLQVIKFVSARKRQRLLRLLLQWLLQLLLLVLLWSCYTIRKRRYRGVGLCTRRPLNTSSGSSSNS